MSQQTSRRQNGNREPPCRDPPIHRLPMQADKRRGAGCDCCDFAVRVNDFLTGGAKPRLSESVWSVSWTCSSPRWLRIRVLTRRTAQARLAALPSRATPAAHGFGASPEGNPLRTALHRFAHCDSEQEGQPTRQTIGIMRFTPPAQVRRTQISPARDRGSSPRPGKDHGVS